MKSIAAPSVLIVATMSGASCSRSNNLLLGRVEAQVGGHTIVVTDCYRTSVPAPDTPAASSYRWMPCRDADVRIQYGLLSVNGRSYGRLADGSTVVVDHGKVLIDDRDVSEVASR